MKERTKERERKKERTKEREKERKKEKILTREYSVNDNTCTLPHEKELRLCQGLAREDELHEHLWQMYHFSQIPSGQKNSQPGRSALQTYQRTMHPAVNKQQVFSYKSSCAQFAAEPGHQVYVAVFSLCVNKPPSAGRGAYLCLKRLVPHALPARHPLARVGTIVYGNSDWTQVPSPY